MRNLPQELLTELTVEFSRIGHLVEIVLNTGNPALNLYYADVDGDVVWDSGQGFGVRTYLSRGIAFDKAQYSLLPKVDNLSFEIDNVQLEVSAAVMNNETRGKQCNIWRAAFGHAAHSANKNPYGVIGATPLFIGYLDRTEITNQRASFTVLNHFQKWNMPTPRRRHSAKCPWTFKDADTCKYGGIESWCDHSYDRCLALNNALNFGGFRWLPSLVDREIRWGR